MWSLDIYSIRGIHKGAGNGKGGDLVRILENNLILGNFMETKKLKISAIYREFAEILSKSSLVANTSGNFKSLFRCLVLTQNFVPQKRVPKIS